MTASAPGPLSLSCPSRQLSHPYSPCLPYLLFSGVHALYICLSKPLFVLRNGSTPQKVRTIVVQKSSPSKMQQLAVTAPVTPMRRGSLRPQATEESSPTDSGGLAFLI
jgi:hypothetical protein